MAGILRLIFKPLSLLVTLYYPEAFVFAALTNKPLVRAYCGPVGTRRDSTLFHCTVDSIVSVDVSVVETADADECQLFHCGIT